MNATHTWVVAVREDASETWVWPTSYATQEKAQQAVIDEVAGITDITDPNAVRWEDDSVGTWDDGDTTYTVIRVALPE